MTWYILHEDLQTPTNGVAYFGPFDESELTTRLNDAYANLLAGCGNLDEVELTDAEAAAIYINPRDYWMEQVRSVESAKMSTPMAPPVPDMVIDLEGQRFGQQYSQRADFRVTFSMNPHTLDVDITVEDSMGTVVDRVRLGSEQVLDALDELRANHDNMRDVPGLCTEPHWYLGGEDVKVDLYHRLEEVQAWLEHAAGEQVWPQEIREWEW